MKRVPITVVICQTCGFSASAMREDTAKAGLVDHLVFAALPNGPHGHV